MADLRLFGSTSNLVRFTLKDKTTGQGKKSLTGSTSGLIISTICDNEASPTVYTQAATHIQTIATLGTYVAPSASNCRFGEVSATNHPGLYEFQFADARFAVTNAKRMVISVNDAEATILDADYEIEFAASTGIAATVADEINTGTTHNITNSLGKQIRTLTAGTGTAIYSLTLPSQSGMTSVQVKLDSGASAVDNAYLYDVFSVISGTGQGSGFCTGYTGSTRVATIDSAWAVQPVAADVVEITPTAKVMVVDKTHFVLDAAGLNQIPVTDPGGVAATFPQMLVAMWRLWFKKSVKAVSGLTIKTYADDGTTVRTTQTYTDDGAGNETRNAAT